MTYDQARSEEQLVRDQLEVELAAKVAANEAARKLPDLPWSAKLEDVPAFKVDLTPEQIAELAHKSVK